MQNIFLRPALLVDRNLTSPQSNKTISSWRSLSWVLQDFFLTMEWRRAVGNGDGWKANIHFRSQTLSVWCRLNLTTVAKAPVLSYIVRAPMYHAEERILRQKVDDLIVLFPHSGASLWVFMCTSLTCVSASRLSNVVCQRPEGKARSPYQSARACWAIYLCVYVLFWISLNSGDVILTLGENISQHLKHTRSRAEILLEIVAIILRLWVQK